MLIEATANVMLADGRYIPAGLLVRGSEVACVQGGKIQKGWVMDPRKTTEGGYIKLIVPDWSLVSDINTEIAISGSTGLFWRRAGRISPNYSVRGVSGDIVSILPIVATVTCQDTIETIGFSVDGPANNFVANGFIVRGL